MMKFARGSEQLR